MSTPRIYCPLPSAKHPGADLATARSADWMLRFSLGANELHRDRLRRVGVGALAAFLVPHASRDGLQLLSDFFMLNLAVDDEYCDEGPFGRQPGAQADVLTWVLRAGETPAHDFGGRFRHGLAMRDIRRRAEDYGSPLQVYRFDEAMGRWFFTEVWRAGLMERCTVLTLDEYALLRLYSGGGRVFIALAAAVNRDGVTVAELVDRRVVALQEMSCFLLGWWSDLVSYSRDADDGVINPIDIIAREQQCSAEEAVHCAVDIFNRVMRLYVALRGDVAATASPGLTRHLTTLAYAARSTFDWCRESPRYGPPPGASVGFDDPVAHAVDVSAEPLELPSIASWWLYDPVGTGARSSDGPAVVARRRRGVSPRTSARTGDAARDPVLPSRIRQRCVSMPSEPERRCAVRASRFFRICVT